MSLDVKTLIVANAVLTAFCGGVLALYRATQKIYPGFGLWMLATCAISVGYFSLLARLGGPMWLSVLLSNLLFSVGVVTRLHSMRVFLELPFSRAWYLAPPLAVAGVLFFLLAYDEISCRNLVMSLYFGLVAGLMARDLWRAALGGGGGLYRINALLYAAFTAMILSRGFSWALQPGTNLFQSTEVHSRYFLALLMFEVAWVLGFVMLNNQRVSRELASADRERKELEGLLPICAHCKSIRDDSGYWRHLEDYISSHSQATFTHSLCPDCLAELYPDLARKMAEKGHVPKEPRE